MFTLHWYFVVLLFLIMFEIGYNIAVVKINAFWAYLPLSDFASYSSFRDIKQSQLLQCYPYVLFVAMEVTIVIFKIYYISEGSYIANLVKIGWEISEENLCEKKCDEQKN